MNNIDRSATLVPAVGAQVERGVRALVENREGLCMTTLPICLGAVAALMLAGYLAACAGAQRWLTLREWL